MKKLVLGVTTLAGALFISTGVVSAHVVVRPKEVLTSAFQTFTVGVPTEKDIPTTNLRIVIPEGLNYVSPNVKPGWRIDIKKTGEGEEAKVTEIIWNGGSIPAGQRDEFMFSAQVPATATTLQWKAYQTYSDGTVVSWDQDADAGHSEENPDAGPYSETLVQSELVQDTEESETSESSSLSFYFSILAIGMAGASLFIQLSRRE